MRKFQLALSFDSPLVRTSLISAVFLIMIVTRMLKSGERLFSVRVLIICGSFVLAGLCVWAAQRFTGQRLTWLLVFFAVGATGVAAVWITAGILSWERARGRKAIWPS